MEAPQQALEPEEEEPLVPVTTATVQAATMVKAAESGAVFCEP